MCLAHVPPPGKLVFLNSIGRKVIFSGRSHAWKSYLRVNSSVIGKRDVTLSGSWYRGRFYKHDAQTALNATHLLHPKSGYVYRHTWRVRLIGSMEKIKTSRVFVPQLSLIIYVIYSYKSENESTVPRSALVFLVYLQFSYVAHTHFWAVFGYCGLYIINKFCIFHMWLTLSLLFFSSFRLLRPLQHQQVLYFSVCLANLEYIELFSASRGTCW